MSPREADRDEVKAYPSGARASVFKADGSGFIYYPSGRVAVYKGILDGRGRYYLYGDDPRSTPLGAVDEHAVGFVTGTGGVRLALNKVGGLLTDRQGYIEREWRYDLGAHMPPPTDILEINLNRSINFEFHDRGDMRIKFLHEGVSHELNAGLRPKREGTYLDHSIRLPGGRLEPRLERISLVSRQQSFGDTMKAKRDRLKPRSRNLEGDCKDLVAGLEQGFDLLGPKVEPFPDPSWKKDAQAATMCELPRIRNTGLELGPTRGFGDTIYADDDRDPMHPRGSWGGGGGINAAQGDIAGGGGGGGGGGGVGGGEAYAEAARLKKDGKWLGELDVRRQLFADNPLLQRSTALQAASGRYGEEIVVPGGRVSASNPTGKVVASGAPLLRVPASRLEGFLEEEASPDQLVAVVCVRGDDSTCNQVEHAAELANSFLLQQSGLADDAAAAATTGGAINNSGNSTPQAAWASATTPPPTESGAAATTSPHSHANESYQIVRVDFGEHQGTADRYGVKSLPAFLMFQGGRLAWSGTLGGRPVKAAPPETAASGRRILLVEPCAKAQIAAERTMRKFGCSWDLVLNASQALSRMQAQVARANSTSMASRTAADDRRGGYGVLMISDSAGAAEVIAMEKAFRGTGGQRDGHGRLIVGLAGVHGDSSCLPNEVLKVVSAGFTDDVDTKRAVLTPQLALVADLAATKPLRASALKAIFRHFSRRRLSCGGIAGEKGEGMRSSMALACTTLIGGDARYMGVTPSRLLDKMEAVKTQAAMGVFAAAPRGVGSVRATREGQRGPFPGAISPRKAAEIFVSAQETDYRGHILGKSAIRTALRT